MTPVFVAPCGWDGLPSAQRRAVERIAAGYDDAVWVAPTDSERIDRWRTEPLTEIRPLELWAPWLSDLADPVLVAVHPSAEPVVLSRRHRIAVVDTSSTPLLEPTIALALRADWVVIPEGHPLARAVPEERIVDLSTGDEAIALHEVDRHADRSPYHRVLTAEMFNRFETAREELADVAGITAYRSARLQHRLADGDAPVLTVSDTCRDSGDDRGWRVAAYSEGAAVGTSPSGNDGLLDTLTELEQASDISSVVSHPAIEDAAAHPLVVRIALDRALAIPSTPDDETATTGVLGLLGRLEDVSDLSPAQVSALGRLPGTETTIASIAERGPRFSAMAARHEQRRHDFDRGYMADAAEVRADIATIDAEAWHTELWHAGLAYWERLDGRRWSPSRSAVSAPPPRANPSAMSLEAVAALDAEARQALADNDYPVAVAGFDRLRAECLAIEGTKTTEIAARLNLAVAHHESGAGPETWQPLVESAITDVRPPVDLVHLRDRLSELASDIESADDLDERHARELERRLDAGDATDDQIIEEIEALAIHTGLFRSGTRYWRRATGSPWPGTTTEAVHVSGGLPGPLELHEQAARWLLRLRRWRLAAWLYRHIRAEALACQPPRVGAERAARVNQGWAASRAGADAATWQPLIGSVLSEVGPPEPQAALRARLLGGDSGEVR